MGRDEPAAGAARWRATLIVVGTESWVRVEERLERYRAALGDRLKVERLPSRHWLLWNAFPATARAVRAFT